MKKCIVFMLLFTVLPAVVWAQAPTNEELYQMMMKIERKFDAAMDETNRAKAEADKAKEEAATAWAFQIVRAARNNDINPWGLAGTIANESNFDRCAIGYHPRNWAVKNNVLRKKRRTISYSAAEVIAAYLGEEKK